MITAREKSSGGCCGHGVTLTAVPASPDVHHAAPEHRPAGPFVVPAPTVPDPALQSEQQHLAWARAELARMRERTLSLEVQGGNRVSSEYLAFTLHRRAAALLDDASTTLFFGRTDHDDGERWYVGRRHVADAGGDPVVIDWRADVARAFYRASRSEPMGVLRRRRFGVEQGRITAYEDEDLTDPAVRAGRSQILAREIERPRVGPMRDIVATIQPEQDEIVRADVGTSVCVQGAPGTGKTAVGLHRAAWLLYAHRERLARAGVLVVGPNASFLEHVAAVLPSLGEAQVRHTTVDALVAAATGHALPGPSTPGPRTSAAPATGPRASGARATGSRSSGRDGRGTDPVPVAVLKGDARLAEVVWRAVWSHIRTPTEALVLPQGSRRWRIPGYQAREIVEELRSRGARYAAARDMLAQRLAHAILVLMEEAGDSPDDRVQDAVARRREVRGFVDATWPALEPASVLLRLWSDAEFLAASADGVLDPQEQTLLLWTRPPRSARSARWSAADLVLLDEIGDVLRRTPSLGHVVLDEAQDLSPMQLRAVGRRCSTGSVTVLGDLAQGTTPWATRSWEESLRHLGHESAVLEILDRGFRVPAAVIEFAGRLLPSIAPGMNTPTSVRDDPGSLAIVGVADAADVPARLVDAVREALRREGSVGVIVPDGEVPGVASLLDRAGLAHTVLGPSDVAADGSGEELLDAALGPDDPTDDPTDSPPDSSPDSPPDSPPDSAATRAGPPRISVVPATTAKGLEYDHVVVLEPTTIAQDEPDERTGLRRLYVVLTRAVSSLAVVHHRPLPPELAGPA